MEIRPLGAALTSRPSAPAPAAPADPGPQDSAQLGPTLSPAPQQTFSVAVAVKAEAPPVAEGTSTVSSATLLAATELPETVEPSLVQAHLAALRSAPPNSYVIDGKVAEGLDVDAIKSSRLFAMKLDKPGAADALVAAGVALAAGVPSLYLAPTRKDLPWFLREADQSYPGQVAVLEGKEPLALADTVATLAERPHQALPAPTRQLDNFIGCLMSGLSEQQYTEGRSHLQAIDQALGPNNYCEGIQVATTTSFGTPKESLCGDIDAVRSSKGCVFYVYDGQSRPSGMWVELGVALAEGLPSQLLYPKDEALPPALRGSSLVKMHAYSDHPSLLADLSSVLR